MAANVTAERARSARGVALMGELTALAAGVGCGGVRLRALAVRPYVALRLRRWLAASAAGVGWARELAACWARLLRGRPAAGVGREALRGLASGGGAAGGKRPWRS